jgi:hypothetical protein
MKTPAMSADLHFLLVFMALGGIFGLLGGVMLIARPGWFIGLGKYANRWISTRGVERKMEQNVDFDRWFYRYSRAGGSLILFGACWIILYFTVYFDKAKFAAALSPHNSAALLEMNRWLESFVLLALLGAVFAAIISLFLLLRPSLLRDFEKGANRWVSTRQVIRPLELRHDGIDHFAIRNNLIIGIVLVVTGLFLLGALSYWLR